MRPPPIDSDTEAALRESLCKAAERLHLASIQARELLSPMQVLKLGFLVACLADLRQELDHPEAPAPDEAVPSGGVILFTDN